MTAAPVASMAEDGHKIIADEERLWRLRQDVLDVQETNGKRISSSVLTCW